MSDQPGSSASKESAVSIEDANKILEETGAAFAVVPLTTCPHLNQVEKLPDYELSAFAPCSVCDLSGENWTCLNCYSTNCSRFVKGHAEEHFKSEKHAMAVSLSDFSVWCYECNAYVHNDVFTPAKDALHKSKFEGEETGPMKD